MDGIKLKNDRPIPLTSDKSAIPTKKENAAKEFERIFALQLVTEMTKGAFKPADNAIGNAGSELYRTQINETLASELAQQGSLGIARLLNDHWNKNPEETK